jgi:hypothetical protein
MSRSNVNYALKKELSKTRSNVLIIVGEKELGIMKKSAQLLSDKINQNQLYIAEGMKHGETSLMYPVRYVELIRSFFSNKPMKRVDG